MLKSKLIPIAKDSSKEATLRKRVMLLIYIVSLLLFAFDMFWISGLQPGGGPYYLGLFAGLAFSFLLDKRGFGVASSCIALLSVNVVVFIFSLTIQELLLLFVPIAISALVLFPAKQNGLRWSFLVSSYVLLAISYFTDVSILPIRIGDPERFIIFFICATTTIISLAMIVHFYISLSIAHEEHLRKNQEELLKLTSNLQASQARFELVIKGSRAGIYEWDVVNNTCYVSPEWKSILGFSNDHYKHFTLNDLVDLTHPDEREELDRRVKEHFKTRLPFQAESRRRHVNGSYRWVFDSGLSISDERGNIVSVVGSIIDITDRKNAELQVLNQNELLKETNEELDRFVYSASHDLRSPLGSILGLITLAEHTNSKDEIKKFHSMMRDRVNRLDSFITEVLEYSRNSRQEIARKPVLLDILIEEILQGYREVKTPISITYQAAGAVINTDSGRLRIVLNNLIGNAVKYYDEEKTQPFIAVRAYVTNEHCKIEIEDNGTGIDFEHQPKIFDMFYRASRQSYGSGLGLYITKEIIEKLDGDISMTSSPGKGTCFIVSLPLN